LIKEIKLTNTRSVRTTTLLAQKPRDFTTLKSKYKLVRYVVPDSFLYKKDKWKHAKLHKAIKEQLTFPYISYDHDKLSNEKQAVLYVLFPHDADIIEITLEFLSEKPLCSGEIQDFGQLELHSLLKLLFADYFRQPNQQNFVSQGKYYAYVKSIMGKGGEHFSDICLQIQINGHRDNDNVHNQEWEVFQISGRATRFRPVEKSSISDWAKRTMAYFQKLQPHDSLVFFNELRKNEIDDYDGEMLYEIKTKKNGRTNIDYHSQSRPQYCRGKILFDFINNFIAYLNKQGITAEQRYRDVQEHKPKGKAGDLPINHLPHIHLFDNRLVTDIPITQYLELLQDRYKPVQFNVLQEIETNSSTPVLLLQDYSREDFEEEGILYEYGEDPYQTIYKDSCFHHIPKQTVNINRTDEEWGDPDEYLDYDIISFGKGDNDNHDYARNFDVALNQLLQKDLVINPRDISRILPGFGNETTMQLSQYAFIRRQTYKGTNYWVLLYVEKNQLQFTDLQNPTGRDKLYNIAEAYGLDWDDIFEQLCNKRFRKPGKDDVLKYYDVILGNGLAVEIEDINETVLYEYDQIIERKDSLTQPYPLEYYLLAGRYDDVRSSSMLPLAELPKDGLLSGKKTKQSIEFYQRLLKFDEYINDLEMHWIEIEFNKLTSDENMEHIGEILGLKRTKSGKYTRRRLWNMYKKCGKFPGAKEGDVHLYQGIWYDDSNSFMVGSKMGLKDTQSHAHRIRQFDVLQEEGNFNIETWLQTLSVTFVRRNQYTVIPYLFHLIDVYVKNVLIWSDD
jgi:hypothetical protein